MLDKALSKFRQICHWILGSNLLVKPFPLIYVSHRCLRSHELRLQVVLQQHLAGCSSSMHTLEVVNKMDHLREPWIDEEDA